MGYEISATAHYSFNLPANHGWMASMLLRRSSWINPPQLWNVRDSDATLLIIDGKLGRGSRLTQRYCHELDKLCMVVDMSRSVDVIAITAWLEGAGVLNVVGSRESKSVGVYVKAFSLLLEVLRQDECREPLIV